jgi:hypothetical protein
MFDRHGITAADPADVAAALAKAVGLNLARRRLLAVGVAGIAMAAGSGAWIAHSKTQGFELQGTVLDDRGLPLAGTEVVAESAATLTDTAGRYVSSSRV